MKKLMALVAMTMALSGNVLAHGDKPKHGGVVSTSNDMSFELVNKDGKATVYVNDHGKPVDTTGATGKLTVLNGTEKTEVSLEPAGSNILASKDDAKLAKGSKAIAALTFADKKTVNVRFSVK
ncbi:hypothetical protein RY831_32100 [Noviherbaspirillum sp. CPCC 100848]|uniref:Uncharacterized protein n=1 Tax=Noviherbaspirillum album TaxID=3080276 RepID=A0ABU6JK02_9BURK|nr:hypothetical protein [Noviherbaspirillum sp. CPCC 100848]MEC4723768.1 hypothetical protein [Noviherbaspirillum sp. CPCC 100848]